MIFCKHNFAAYRSFRYWLLFGLLAILVAVHLFCINSSVLRLLAFTLEYLTVKPLISIFKVQFQAFIVNAFIFGNLQIYIIT